MRYVEKEKEELEEQNRRQREPSMAYSRDHNASLKLSDGQVFQVQDAVKKAVGEETNDGSAQQRLGTFSLRQVSVCFSQSEMMLRFDNRKENNRVILPYHEDVCDMFMVGGGRTLWEVIAEICQSSCQSYVMVEPYDNELEEKLTFLYTLVTTEYCDRQGYYDTELTTAFLTFLEDNPRAHTSVVFKVKQLLAGLPDVEIMERIKKNKVVGIVAFHRLLSAKCMQQDVYLQLKRQFLSAFLCEAGGASSDVETQSQ